MSDEQNQEAYNRRAAAEYLRHMARLMEQDKIDAFDIVWQPSEDRPRGQILFSTNGIHFAPPAPQPPKIEFQDLTGDLKGS